MLAVGGLCIILFMEMYRSTIRGGDEDENHSVEITCSDNLDDKTRSPHSIRSLLGTIQLMPFLLWVTRALREARALLRPSGQAHFA